MTDNEVKWLIVGKLLRRNLMAGVKEATMYSYNGTVLPALPVVAGYGYAFMRKHSIAFVGTPVLYLSATKPFVPTASSVVIVEGIRFEYDSQSGAWVNKGSVTDSVSMAFLMWSNFNIEMEGGTLIYEATDPIPVYE